MSLCAVTNNQSVLDTSSGCMPPPDTLRPEAIAGIIGGSGTLLAGCAAVAAFCLAVWTNCFKGEKNCN